MRIAELKDKQKDINIDVKIIFDQMKEMEKWGHRIKAVVVVDVDSENSDTTALLDLYDADIDLYSFQSKLRVINGYAKKIKTKKGEQMLINYGWDGKQLIGHYEKI